MKKLMTSVVFLFFMATSAMADYTIYLPTKPGSGLDQWAQVVIKELKKHVDGEVKSVHIPGARHLIGMNKWNKENRFKELEFSCWIFLWAKEKTGIHEMAAWYSEMITRQVTLQEWCLCIVVTWMAKLHLTKNV